MSQVLKMREGPSKSWALFGWSDSLVSAIFPISPISPFLPFTESTWEHAVFPHFPTTLKAHGNKLSLKTFYTALLISFYSWSGKCRVAIAANVFSFSCVQFGDFSEIVRGVFIFCKRKSDSRVSWVGVAAETFCTFDDRFHCLVSAVKRLIFRDCQGS
jgi:hypothetical protein